MALRSRRRALLGQEVKSSPSLARAYPSSAVRNLPLNFLPGRKILQRKGLQLGELRLASVSFDPAKVFGGVLDSSSIILGPNLRKNHEKQDGHKKVVGPIKAQEAERAHGGRVVASNINHASFRGSEEDYRQLRQGSYGRHQEAPATTEAGTPGYHLSPTRRMSRRGSAQKRASGGSQPSQQRSVCKEMPVHSEHDDCSFALRRFNVERSQRPVSSPKNA